MPGLCFYGKTDRRDRRMKTDGPELTLRRCIAENVRAALAEDVGDGDLTARLVPAAQQVSATVVSRDGAVICGQPWFDEVYAQLDASITVDWQIDEGGVAAAGQTLCTVRGHARPILTGERSALNFLQLLSATATAARAYVNAVEGHAVRILDTRKTIPGLRAAQKYAVRCGGGVNHRHGLFDAILIKENHIIAAGGIAAAVKAARSVRTDVLVEVEAETLEQLDECLDARADRILLDNFSDEMLREAVRRRNARAPDIGLEASGGMTLDRVAAIAGTGVNFISVGSLTKNVQAIDLSMRFDFRDAR